MKRALVTTTIRPPVLLSRWVEQLSAGDVVVVVGDLKTPHEEVELLCADWENKYDVDAVYLRPEDQESWKVSEPVGWNCIQRRSVGFLEALRRAPDVDYLVTADDDNFPVGLDHIEILDDVFAGAGEAPVVHSESGWLNPASVLRPSVVHRGMPVAKRHTGHGDPGTRTTHRPPGWRTGVMASLWLGDPDVDAVERIAHSRLETTSLRTDVTLAPGTWGPFNSQATAFLRQLTPALLMWPHVGRYDDIWASYLAQAVCDDLNLRVEYGDPLVRQERNEHDLVSDLEAELFGMRHTPAVVKSLRDLAATLTVSSLPTMSLVVRVNWALMKIAKLPFIPVNTARAFEGWREDLDTLTREHGVSFDLTPEMGGAP